MGARGPHDDFETAKNVIRAAFAEFTLRQDVDAIRDAYVADDVEYVTRDGVFRGTDRWMSETRVQMESFRFEIEVEEIIDAGEGAVILFNKALRKDKESGAVVWKAWPAVVARILDGKFVFFEGYVDRRQALDDCGVEQG